MSQISDNKICRNFAISGFIQTFILKEQIETKCGRDFFRIIFRFTFGIYYAFVCNGECADGKGGKMKKKGLVLMTLLMLTIFSYATQMKVVGEVFSSAG